MVSSFSIEVPVGISLAFVIDPRSYAREMHTVSKFAYKSATNP